LATAQALPGPGVDLGLVPLLLVGWEYVAHVDAGVLLVQVEARAAWLDLASDGGRHAAPRALDLREIFGDRTDRAVFLDQTVDQVVERLELVLVNADIPVPVRHDVVTGAGLRLGGRRQLVFLTLRGDEVDIDLALVLFAPLVAELDQRLVGAGYPMVPHAQGQRPGGVRATDIGGSDSCSRTECRGLENGTTRKT
jgi:hypothetical protein